MIAMLRKPVGPRRNAKLRWDNTFKQLADGLTELGKYQIKYSSAAILALMAYQKYMIPAGKIGRAAATEAAKEKYGDPFGWHKARDKEIQKATRTVNADAVTRLAAIMASVATLQKHSRRAHTDQH